MVPHVDIHMEDYHRLLGVSQPWRESSISNIFPFVHSYCMGKWNNSGLLALMFHEPERKHCQGKIQQAWLSCPFALAGLNIAPMVKLHWSKKWDWCKNLQSTEIVASVPRILSWVVPAWYHLAKQTECLPHFGCWSHLLLWLKSINRGRRGSEIII